MGRAMSLAPRAVGHIPRGDPTGTRQRGHHPPVKGRGPLSCPQSRSLPPAPGPPQPRRPHLARECASPSTGNKTPSVRPSLLHTYRSDPYGGHKSPLIKAPTIEMPFMGR